MQRVPDRRAAIDVVVEDVRVVREAHVRERLAGRRRVERLRRRVERGSSSGQHGRDERGTRTTTPSRGQRQRPRSTRPRVPQALPVIVWKRARAPARAGRAGRRRSRSRTSSDSAYAPARPRSAGYELSERQMREVNTQTPPGIPSSAGTSNASSARMATISTAASSAGRTSGSVTRRKTDGSARAAREGRLLERRVDRAERRRHQQEHERRRDGAPRRRSSRRDRRR